MGKFHAEEMLVRRDCKTTTERKKGKEKTKSVERVDKGAITVALFPSTIAYPYEFAVCKWRRESHVPGIT